MAKKVFYDEEARRRVLGGAEALYNAVKVTMGPKGRNVVISKTYGGPTVTHDGVTVAKDIDIQEDDDTLGYKVGAELIKQAANKLNDVAGDGTTTVTVLTYHILNEANKLVAAGHNPMELRKGIEEASAQVIKKLGTMSENISNKPERVAQVATISAGDAEIGKLIADVIKQVGKDGVVTVEESQGLEMESEIVAGTTIDRGFVSPYMVTDTARMEAIYDNPVILITDKKLTSIQEFLPILEKAAQAGKKDMVIIAEDVEGDALGTLILNRLKGVFNTVAIKAPGFGDRKSEILQDIAALTGATVVTEDIGLNFENIDIDVLGTARRVIVGKDNTTIIEGAGTKKAIDARINQINNQIANADAAYEKEGFTNRRAALQGKVAVIKVGGASETEIEEKKFRVDDAVAAVKAALDEGIVPGGAVTLVSLSDSIKINTADINVEGKQLLKTALLQPFYELMRNSAINPDEWLPKVREAKAGYGINVINPGKVIDLKAAGVVDPVRVTREAISSAASIAGTAITMGALVVELPEKEDQSAAAAGMGGMGMM